MKVGSCGLVDAQLDANVIHIFGNNPLHFMLKLYIRWVRDVVCKLHVLVVKHVLLLLFFIADFYVWIDCTQYVISFDADKAVALVQKMSHDEVSALLINVKVASNELFKLLVMEVSIETVQNLFKAHFVINTHLVSVLLHFKV